MAHLPAQNHGPAQWSETVCSSLRHDPPSKPVPVCCFPIWALLSPKYKMAVFFFCALLIINPLGCRSHRSLQSSERLADPFLLLEVTTSPRAASWPLCLATLSSAPTHPNRTASDRAQAAAVASGPLPPHKSLPRHLNRSAAPAAQRPSRGCCRAVWAAGKARLMLLG